MKKPRELFPLEVERGAQVFAVANALLPLHNGDLVSAFKAAMFESLRLGVALREENGGIVVTPPDHPVIKVFNRGGRLILDQEVSD